MTTKTLTWTRMENGDRLAEEHPILLAKPGSRSPSAPGWLVKTPNERDMNFDDGWHWTAVANPAYHNKDGGGGMYLDGADLPMARALVAKHLDYILTQIPADYGQPAPEIPPAPAPTWTDLFGIDPNFTDDAPDDEPPAAAPNCACGCSTEITPTRVYAPGHDARHRDRLVDLLVGRGDVRARATRIQHLIDGLEDRN